MPERRLTVVIADDCPFLRETLRLLLRHDDYEIVGEAPNGEVALTLCRRFQPDVVVLDINMPIKDGLAVLDELAASKYAGKIIIISAEATLDKVKLAVEKGAAGFIMKPIKPATMLDELRACLRG